VTGLVSKEGKICYKSCPVLPYTLVVVMLIVSTHDCSTPQSVLQVIATFIQYQGIDMQIGIPRESLAGETRVAATPATVEQLKKLGFDVAVESGAGALASFDDAAFEAAGAVVVDTATLWQSPLIYKVNAPSEAEIALLQDGTTLVSFVWPAQNPELVAKLSAKKINVLAMDMVPRISRAQALDALSSMANIGGYRAVVEAAHAFGRFFTGQITAAGKVPPAKVLVIGAGVAGLAAIGAAGSLGAIVRAFDTRLEVAEQIESMGGQFLKLDFSNEAGGSSDGYAKVMSEVDLASAAGGNCEYTQPGELITTASGVKIIGYTDLPGRLPTQSSQLYATNLVNLTKLLSKEKDGTIDINFEDVVLRNMSVVRDGEVTFPPPAISVSAAPKKETVTATVAKEAKKPSNLKYWLAAAGIAGFGWVGHVAPPEFLSHFTVFVLACVVGYYVVWNVTHSLHTPLMSVTNAISGIIVVGALLQIGAGSGLIAALAFVAVLIATINIVGGFTVTHRMLKMFRKD